MRPVLFGLLILGLSCSDNPPTPGQPCKPTPEVTGACYDSANLVYCEKQSDGQYRWSEFLECGPSNFSDSEEIKAASCGCSPPYGATRGYPNLQGNCNCWGTH